MAQSKSTIVWGGEIGNLAKSVASGILTNAALDTFATFCQGHSDAQVAVKSYASREVDDTAPGAGSDTDVRGVVYMQDTDTGNTIRFTIPGIMESDTELVPGRQGGKRLTDTFLGLFKSAFETATGKTVRMLYGRVVRVV